MLRTDAWDSHEKFKELCALAQCRSLSVHEQLELDRHLKACESCRAIHEEYSLIGKEGMPSLATDDDLTKEVRNWDSSRVRASLQASIRRPRQHRVLPIKTAQPSRASTPASSISRKALAIASLAACALIVLTWSAYHMGERKQAAVSQASTNVSLPKQISVPEKNTSAEILAAQSAQISSLEKQLAGQRQELTQLRAASGAAEQRVSEMGTVNVQKESNLRQLTAERDQLANQLIEKERAYQVLQTDYTSLRAEHDRYLLHTASLESELTNLHAVSRDQEGRLKDEEQFLSSDRDIRELMGARKLYIADVFDVDSVSHTRKPFGRVFYTQSKSLVFYAFDLDHQPGVKNASVFQVWGQRDAEANGAPHPMNLGILYMDSESNRRWVLRSDDPKQLAEIDAVFVTVEPHGGSQKPTGKPLLYALLRKEANHP
jgi:hypothetical protein